MALTPFACVAILARAWRWSELLLPIAVFSALAAKDPAVLLVRQRFIWKHEHPDAPLAAKWLAVWFSALIVSAVLLLLDWPLKAVLWMGFGIGCFSLLAVAVNVRNHQRSVLFQLASGAALTSSSLATCLSATGVIAPWCWWFWALSTAQAFAGILVVRARLDARLALRGTPPPDQTFRKAAMWSIGLLACAAVTATILRKGWIAVAIILAVVGYWYDLRAQTQKMSLQMPLMVVGQRSLALSLLYSGRLILGFW